MRSLPFDRLEEISHLHCADGGVRTFISRLCAHAFDCLCFVCVGFAFKFTYVPFLVATYVAGFIIATFILQTIGAVEILIALILGAYGATAGEAAAIALAYRGLIFWVPFIIGAVCINITGTQKELMTEQPVEETVLAKGAEENLDKVEEAHTAYTTTLAEVVERVKRGDFEIPDTPGWPMPQPPEIEDENLAPGSDPSDDFSAGVEQEKGD